MTLQEVIAILLAVTAIAGYINSRFIRLPTAIGITLVTLLASLVFIILDKLGLPTVDYTQIFLQSIDFNSTVLGGLISFLLFAGGLHINAIELMKHKWSIFTLSTLGVLLSAAIVGFGLWGITLVFDTKIDLTYCLLFGALIAPTDPIAVLSIFKRIKVPKSLEMRIAGESLFNDGISIVLFVTLLELSTNATDVSQAKVFVMFLQQLAGGILYGALLGLITNWLLKSLHNFGVAMLMTVALVTGGYLVAIQLGTSGPIAMVVAGLIIGAKLKHGGLSNFNAEQLQSVWELIDEFLNAILFVLIGLAVFQLAFTLNALIVAVISIPLVLAARYISVAIPISGLSLFMNFTKNSISIMTWGGLRGGISIALALSLPASEAKNEVLAATYAVVVFSIIIQGLTIEPMMRALMSNKPKI